MTDLMTAEPYGVLTEPTTLTIQRLLPASVERVWTYLTDGELRRRWFAAGEMELAPGAPLELVWRNDELTDPPGERPAGASGEGRMRSRVIAADPPRRLVIAWGEAGEVTFELEPAGAKALLTIVHRGVPSRDSLLAFAPGWHAHLGVLEALLAERRPEPFWDEVRRLKPVYAERFAEGAPA